MNDETVRLILDLGDSSKHAKDVKESVDDLGRSLHKTGDAADEVGKKTGNMGQSLLQGGRVIQDFTQGGLGGILNNIEGLSLALGLGSGVAGALTVLGVVALTWGPSIKSFFTGLVDGVNDLPKSADKVELLTDQFKKNADALEELKKKQTVTNTELETYNRLTGEQVRLEKELTAAKKERQIIEQLLALRPAGTAETEKERAENLQVAVGGRQEEVVGEVARAMAGREVASLEQELDRISPAGVDRSRLPEANQVRIQQIITRLLQHQRETPKEITERARGQVAQAVIGGNEAATRGVLDLLPRTSEFRSTFREAARSQADRVAEAEADAAVEAGNQRAHEARLRREADAKKAADDAKKKEREQKEAKREADAEKEREERAKKIKDAEAARDQDTLAKGLGDTWIAQAERALLERPNNARLRQQITQAAQQKLMAGGMSPEQARRLAGGVDEFLGKDITRQEQLLGGAVKGRDKRLYDTLGVILENQAALAAQQSQQLEQLHAMGRNVRGTIETNRSQASFNGSY